MAISEQKPLAIAVIGGGAAGFFGAIAAARTYPQAQVTLWEAGRQLLTKVRISGGGRCNVTHACFETQLLVQNYPRGSKALQGAFSRFQAKDTVAWFERVGIALKTEADGRMFPVTDDSETIVHGLMQAAIAARVVIRTGTPVSTLERHNDRFTIGLKSGENIFVDRVLLATGSSVQGHHLAQKLGHTIEPPVPSLFTFTIQDPSLRALAGIAVPQVHLTLKTEDGSQLQQSGALLITHWGLSGPAVLKLSAWGARLLHSHRYQATLLINWLPMMQLEQVQQRLTAVKQALPRKAILNVCPFSLPQRLWDYLVRQSGADPDGRCSDWSKKQISTLSQILNRCPYRIQGKGVFKEEFVTCGGVSLKSVDFKTMESRCCPGLYFAGEILDIDGVTGGFNFQSAWTTAWIAGQAIGQ